MLVMATLPVIDWNDCLLRDLRALHQKASVHVYAAMVMIDPFACWEDFADLLKDAKISGVVNFPPASIIERPTAGMPVNTGLEPRISAYGMVRKPRIQDLVHCCQGL